jgi:hypothetical protein
MLFTCEERRGTRIRRVEEVRPSIELEEYLRHRLPRDRSPIKNLEMIWSVGVRIFLVDDIGVMLKGPLEYIGLPDVHIAFWDKILNGREAMCRSMAQKIAEESHARGVFTAISKTGRATIAFARRVGFRISHTGETSLVLTMLFT